LVVSLINVILNHSFKTWPGPAGRSGTQPTRGWNRAGLKKKQEKEKNPVWTGWPGQLTRQDPVKNPVAIVEFCFFFFLKRHHIDFLKKQIDPDDPVTRSKLGTRVLDQTGHWAGSKNYVLNAWLVAYVGLWSVLENNLNLGSHLKNYIF